MQGRKNCMGLVGCLPVQDGGGVDDCMKLAMQGVSAGKHAKYRHARLPLQTRIEWQQRLHLSAEEQCAALRMCCVAAMQGSWCLWRSSSLAPQKQWPHVALQTRQLQNTMLFLLMPFWVLRVQDTTDAAHVDLPLLHACRHWPV